MQPHAKVIPFPYGKALIERQLKCRIPNTVNCPWCQHDRYTIQDARDSVVRCRCAKCRKPFRVCF